MLKYSMSPHVKTGACLYTVITSKLASSDVKVCLIKLQGKISL
jgi:hypothetical protein